MEWAALLKVLPEIILGIMRFPEHVLQLIRVLKKTSQEKHQDILDRIAKEEERFEDTGRPQW